MRGGLILCVMMVAVAGCETAEECATDDACASGSHCALGECITQCEEDADCATLGAGATCDASRGRCSAPMDPDAGVEPCEANADCANGQFCDGDETCVPGADDADARGCVAGTAPCGEGETCDEAGDECVAMGCETPDADGDGRARFACGGDDCDDDDVNRFPGNAEVCDVDGHDEDCSPLTYGFVDLDSDGYVSATCCNDDGEGGTSCGDDCDDMRAVSHPNHVEVCDTFDNDCDGAVDEDVVPRWYADTDGDGYGDPEAAVMQCMAPVGYVALGTDCRDDARDINPVASEDCDGVDNNCDGLIDSADASVECACLEDETIECGVSDLGECRLGTRTCAASGTFGPCEGNIDPIPESCNGLNDDCDASVDEGVLTTCYRDVDGDGRGTPTDVVEVCSACPDGYVTTGGDCNDERADTYTGAPELCDRRDNDCSSGGGVDVSEDADDDGHAPSANACSGGFPKDDCMDDDAAIYGGNQTYYQYPKCSGNNDYCPAADCCVRPETECQDSTWVCILCTPGDPRCVTRSWDYNCSGSLEVAPVVTGDCTFTTIGLDWACRGSGPLEAADSCSDVVMYRRCVLNGLSRTCDAEIEMRTPGCH